jgi:hypothetical protein
VAAADHEGHGPTLVLSRLSMEGVEKLEGLLPTNSVPVRAAFLPGLPRNNTSNYYYYW